MKRSEWQTAHRLLSIGVGCILGACSQREAPANEVGGEYTYDTSSNMLPVDMDMTGNGSSAAGQSVHNYDFEENGLYGYIAAVSDEDRARGKAAGDVSMFAYRGIRDGMYQISSVDDEGRTRWRYECSVPCRAIRVITGGAASRRLAYNPQSLIGAAFEDAIAGRLRALPEPRQSSEREEAESDGLANTSNSRAPGPSSNVSATINVPAEGGSGNEVD